MAAPQGKLIILRTPQAAPQEKPPIMVEPWTSAYGRAEAEIIYEYRDDLVEQKFYLDQLDLVCGKGRFYGALSIPFDIHGTDLYDWLIFSN